MTAVKMNFLRDWHEEIIKEMRKEGLSFDKNTQKDLLVIRYFSYLRKKGTRKPYNVFKSKEFFCPPELENGLEQLVKILENGSDFSPYLSKQVEKLKNDGMFNDWGILHLHLGVQMESNGKYVERTGPLLFVCFKKEDAYLINVFQHNDWTKREVLQIIQNNWPETIKPFVIEGCVGISPELTEEQHQQLRDNGFSTLVELTDTQGNKLFICPPGMGITTSGDSIIDVMNYNKQVNSIKKIEKDVISCLATIKDDMKKENLTIPNTLVFKLVSENNKFAIRESNTGLLVVYA